MTVTRPFHLSPRDYLVAERPDEPVMFLSPEMLQATARRFLDGFPGLVTYAVKANPSGAVVENLVAAGIAGFDVASPAEIALMRSAAPEAALHYNNPVRSMAEIEAAVELGLRSFAVDCPGELDKLAARVAGPGTEISVRFKLPVKGGAYDFGAKFGATPEAAAELLGRAASLGFSPSLTFHPGTQCTDPAAWTAYIETAAGIARQAGVTLHRLNVGGGFPARRMRGEAPALDAIFTAIGEATRRAFGGAAPGLVCEPGRAMVAEAVSIALRIKAVRDEGAVFLNDGIYGSLAEQAQMPVTDRIAVLSPEGNRRSGPARPVTLWGPTCDSLDRIPGQVALPGDMAEGDYLLIHGMGAYSTAIVTRFNGYGGLRMATVRELRA